MSVVQTKTYPEPPICEREILRYAGCREPDAETRTLLQSCLAEARARLSYKVCFRELPVTIAQKCCDFGAFWLCSKELARNLSGCERVILFAATIGVEIDRLITKYSRISPAKALMFQAIGAERIEALCDLFCEEIAREAGLQARPRFGPGYDDLPLEIQRTVFSLLDCSRWIGLSLNDSLLMSPSKSVTAFVGLTKKASHSPINKCSLCGKRDCAFRGDP